MKIVIDIPEEEYKRMVEKRMFGRVDVWKDAICNGIPLPEGAEILTAEAYSDLCLRASHGRKTGKWILVEMGDTNLYECSLCGYRKEYKHPFCEECGAKMEGANE